jgi:hypothetical protein
MRVMALGSMAITLALDASCWPRCLSRRLKQIVDADPRLPALSSKTMPIWQKLAMRSTPIATNMARCWHSARRQRPHRALDQHADLVDRHGA